jgi:hypothetical protein
MRKIVTPRTQVQTGFFFWELEHPATDTTLVSVDWGVEWDNGLWVLLYTTECA